MPIRKLKQSLLDQVRCVFPEVEETPAATISCPPDPEMGDLTLQCFPLAQALRRGPQQIAAQLAEASQALPGFCRVAQAGPYVNFFLDPVTLAQTVLDQVRDQGEAYGHVTSGAGQTVVVDYSSPNIAKPFGIGHLRSTVIGAALYRLYQAAGFRAIGINHLGDWGTQFGLLMTAFEDEGDEAALEADPVEYCYRLYVAWSKKRAEDPAIADRARQWFKRLEDADPAAVALWEKMRELSLREFARVYEKLGVRFDYVRGESYYNALMPAMLAQLEAAGLLKLDQGAMIVDLSDCDLPPALLIKSDGASTYLLRDLAAAESRHEEFGFDLCLYVIGTPQALHMRQLREVLGRLGCAWAAGIEHINFGHIQGMKTREGNLIFLEQVLDEAAQRSRQKIEENVERGWTDTDLDVAAVSSAVGLGAIIFNDLKQNRCHEITFDWDRMLSLEGDSGPYLQYAYSRACGILRKGESVAMPAFDAELFAEASAQDKALFITLAGFSTALERAVAENAPHHLCQYLLDLATDFSRWYTGQQVLGSGEWQPTRLAVVHAVKQVLGNGLRLLGLQTLERM